MFFYVTPKGIGDSHSNSLESKDPRVTIQVEGDRDPRFRAYCGSGGISISHIGQRFGTVGVTEFGSNLNFLVGWGSIAGFPGVTFIITGGTPSCKEPLAGVFTTETDLTEVQIFWYLLQTLRVEISTGHWFCEDLESLVKVLTTHLSRIQKDQT